MPVTEKLIEEIRQLSDEELRAVLRDVTKRPEQRFEIRKTSELEDKVSEKMPVVVLDKKLGRKLRAGEETRLHELSGRTALIEADVLTPPAGGTTISGMTVDYSDIVNALYNDFGPVVTGGGVFLSDSFYFLYADADVQKVLSEDLTDLEMWINTYFDCDDFAQVVAGVMNHHLRGIPFGTLWFQGPGIYHAVNCFYSMNDKRMKVVEPQTDAIYYFNKSVYKPVLVVI